MRWPTDTRAAVGHSAQMTPSVDPIAADAAHQDAFFHLETGAVRFWVPVPGGFIGASIGKATLHYRYAPLRTDDDALSTYREHRAEIDAAVQRRLAGGAREPVMLRDWDLRTATSAGVTLPGP